MMQGDGSIDEGADSAPEGVMASPDSRDSARPIVERMRGLPDSLGHANERLVGFVQQQPLLAIGAALGIGYVLGRLFRRVS